MENKKKTLGAALGALRPKNPELKELLLTGEVLELSVNQAERRISLRVGFDRVCEPELIAELEEEIKGEYGLASASLSPVFQNGGFFPGRHMRMLIDEIAAEQPAAAGFLEGFQVLERGNELVLLLPRAGAGVLSELGVPRRLSELIFERFRVPGKKVIFEERENGDPAEDLSRYAKEYIDSLPRPEPSAPEPPRERKKESFRRARAPRPSGVSPEDVLMGAPFGEESMEIRNIYECGEVCVEGEVFATDSRLTRSEKELIVSADITDRTSSVRIKKIFPAQKGYEFLAALREGSYIRVRGNMEFDKFYNDRILKPVDIYLTKGKKRADNAQKKRVELHLHTTMSQMDAVSSASALVGRAKEWGQSAVAITDHGVVQGFPEALSAAGGIKVLYGVEGYFINDLADVEAVSGQKDGDFSGEFVCFDIETTGTNPMTEGITEIAACVVRGGEVCETFHTYANPGKPISAFISNLTGITDEMVKDAPGQPEAVSAFIEFAAGRILVAHNAKFDVSFIKAVCASEKTPCDPTAVDTLELSRILLPGLPRHKLDSVARALELPEFRHHSAAEDTKALALIFIKLLEMARTELGVSRVSQLNEALSDRRRENQERGEERQNLPVRHIILLAKNKTGLKNLYRLISSSHIKHMNRRKQPIIPRHELERRREGLIVGSACEAGELYSAVVEGRPWKELKKIASFYDYLEIQPLGNNEFMVRDGVKISRDEYKKFTREDLMEFNRQIVRLGEELGLPVAATGDVHFLDPEDKIYREILMTGSGFSDAANQAPLYLRTTEEMLAEFSYLGEKKAREVVVENTNKIADMCEAIKPFPDGLFPPSLPGSGQELERLTMSRAKELYGDPLPEIVLKAIDRELKPIISHGFDVMYMLSQKLIARSMEEGYLVGSRGSVGSSVVAFFAGITEINSLPPHYRCPNCRYSEFHPECDLGPDMDDKNCPECGAPLEKDGYDIPFETFLGFDCDKDPDIDLNFSSEYQARAHRHTIELFGEDKVFRAGTISTLASATAFGYVKKFFEEKQAAGEPAPPRAELDRLIKGCMGVKKTTGQHPGGLIVIPKDKEICDFCPVQHPGSDDTDIITTHIDYHSIDKNLLKFDLLGKDDPTVLRYLEDNTGVKVEDVPIDDPQMLSIFTSNDALGIPGDAVTGPNGALGIPEFGTRFVREMLNDTMPVTIGDLVRISGLSHGESVWLGNAQDLIKNGLELRDCICCRDDIMNYLIKKGMDPKLSFAIMETVRKKAKDPAKPKLKDEWMEEMRALGVPDWYIDSCNKIAYLFPKAHAAAYVLMALRIAWFKVYRPLAYYGSFFGIKAKNLDASVMLAGDQRILEKLKEIEGLGRTATATDRELARALEISHEFLLRGFSFLPVDIYKSDPVLFLIDREKNALRLPLRAVPGLGDIAASELVAEREKAPFSTVEDIAARCKKLSSTVTDELVRIGATNGLPRSAQSTLFEL